MKSEVARKLCGKTGMVLNYATANGWRDAGNPASLRIMKTVRKQRQGDTETACRNLLRELGVDRRTGTLHGFRSSFRTWCAETGTADDIAEACLAHTVPDQVVRAYKRTTFFAARVDVCLLPPPLKGADRSLAIVDPERRRMARQS
jgi:hypothetical protein